MYSETNMMLPKFFLMILVSELYTIYVKTRFLPGSYGTMIWLIITPNKK